MPPFRYLRAALGFLVIVATLMAIDEVSAWLLPPLPLRHFISAIAVGGTIFLAAFKWGALLPLLIQRRVEGGPYDAHCQSLLVELPRPPGGPRVDFCICQTEKLIAFSANNGLAGSILVSTGLLDALPRDALLGVVAHEYSHIQARHSARHAAILATVAFVNTQFGIPAPATIVVLLTYLHVSRRWEFDADAMAVRLVGVAPVAAALTAFQKLEVPKKDPPAWTQFLHTHPSLSRRLAVLSQRG
jgi:Zn-dependent protease with chaperone function